ncbi:MAG: hypothetical protein V2I33_16745 [Kangiellaceae bacterium]|jgi:hypothetical protein|nr:hypothetical protein [Kangiellaceae bacterium]
MVLWLSLLLALGAAASTSDIAGVRMAVGQGLLTEIEDAYLPKILAKLSGENLGDYKIEGIKWLISYDLEFSDLTIDTVQVD